MTIGLEGIRRFSTYSVTMEGCKGGRIVSTRLVIGNDDVSHGSTIMETLDWKEPFDFSSRSVYILDEYPI